MLSFFKLLENRLKSSELRPYLNISTLTAGNISIFYNNGNTDKLKVYVSSATSTKLEVVISRGLRSTPPYSNRPLKKATDLGSVTLELTKDDLKTSNLQQNESLKGEFTIGIKSKKDGIIHIFWNNKADLNYIELTPSSPTAMQLVPDKSFYFSFYAQDVLKG